jgi:hypothetical protein
MLQKQSLLNLKLEERKQPMMAALLMVSTGSSMTLGLATTETAVVFE